MHLLPPYLLGQVSGLQIGISLDYHLDHVNPFNLIFFQHCTRFFLFLRVLKFLKDHTDEQIEEEETAYEDENHEKVSVRLARSEFRAQVFTLDVDCIVHVVWPVFHSCDGKESYHSLRD
jgi:hypothetical protein